MINFWDTFWSQIVDANWIELVAMITGVISVWLASRNNILVYPIGFISTMLYTIVYIEARLYALCLLQIFFSAMSLIGWYNWSQKKGLAPRFPISWCNARDYWSALIVLAVMALIVTLVMPYNTGVMPWGDSASAALQVIGMWWMTRRKIENWIAWSLANVIAIPICIQTTLYFTAFQYMVFLVLAVQGYRKWKQDYEAR